MSQTGFALMVFLFMVGGLFVGGIMGTQYANDQIADLHAEIEQYELSIAAMEQHCFVRDERADEQAQMIDLLIEENTKLRRWKYEKEGGE